MASRFRSLASVLRALARTSAVPPVARLPGDEGEASLDTARVLEILRRGQRGEPARRARDTPARGLLAPAGPGSPGPSATPESSTRAPGGVAGSGEGEGGLQQRRSAGGPAHLDGRRGD